MHLIVHVHLLGVHHGQLQELSEFSVFSLANVLNDGGTDNFRLIASITELTAQEVYVSICPSILVQTILAKYFEKLS